MRSHWLVFAVLLTLGLFTLNVSPLPWYDEVDFASISHSYLKNKTFVCEANDLYFPVKGREVLYYGPVYFVLTGFVTKLFGFGMVQVRVLNFIAGVACIFLFIKLFERLSGKKCGQGTKIIIALLMISDYTYIQDMHSGRMDLLALMFALAGLLLADVAARRWWWHFILSGLLIGLALLTTPRVYFIIVPYYAWLLYLCIREGDRRILAGVACAAATACLLYLAWILLKFGGIRQWMDYFNAPTTYFKSAAADFFMPGIPMPAEQAMYYLLLLVLLAITAARGYKTLIKPEILVPSMVLLLFLALAGGSVIYMSLVTGFIYLLIINLANNLGKAKYIALALLLAVNFGMAGYKYFVVLSNYDIRNPRELNNWVSKMVPRGSKVVADDKYYYAVVENQSQYQYIERGGTDAERAVYHADHWKADYLLVGDTTGTLFAEYRKHTRLSLLDEYRPDARPGGYYGNYTWSYHGFLFRFLR